MITPTSYLQTLSQNDAVAFIASLQKVKAHLSNELAWMNTQLQQRTEQLEGIEAILLEAVSIGIVAHSAIVSPSTAATTDETPATKRADFTDAAIVAPTVASTAEPTDSTATQPSRGRNRQDDLKPQRRVKTTRNQQDTTNAKKPKSSIRKPGKGRKSAEGAELGQFLQAEFQDKTLIESIAQVLDDSSEPLETDDIMAELYAGLSNEDYNRAKRSIANLLSLGKRKGKWQSMGRGRYTGNVVTTS